MGCAPRNPAPRNHLLVWIVKPEGCHCMDGHLTSRVLTEDQQISQSADPLRSTSPFSDKTLAAACYYITTYVTLSNVIINDVSADSPGLSRRAPGLPVAARNDTNGSNHVTHSNCLNV